MKAYTLFPEKSYTVSCHVAQDKHAVLKLKATTAHGAAVAFAEKQTGLTHVCDGRMETGQGPVHWSFSAIGCGQRIYVRETTLP